MSHWSRWLGNENGHQVSKLANGTNIFLQYEQFKVASAKDKYKLTVGGFQGTTTDPMAYHNGMNFTTIDSDNDRWVAIVHYGLGEDGGIINVQAYNLTYSTKVHVAFMSTASGTLSPS